MKQSSGKDEITGEKKVSPSQEPKETEPIRPDLAEVIDRHAYGLDERRPDVVAQRQQKNQRTARAYINDLYDADSFIEYGALAIAAQRSRRTEEDLIRRTPADGLIAGIG